MRTTTLSSALFATVLAFATACGSKPDEAKKPTSPGFSLTGREIASTNGKFQVDAEWQNGPKSREENVLKLTFVVANQLAETANVVEVSGTMPTMPTMPPVKPKDLASSVADGASPATIIVKGTFFTMSGDWQLAVKATVNGQEDEAVIGLKVN